MWRYNPFTGNLDRVGLINVAPLCTIETDGWTGSQSGEVLFTGDGTTVDFSGKVDLPPVNPLNSFTLHYTIGGTTYNATADENGNITGTHITSGTINQDGNYEIHFDTAPDNGTDGTADYDYGIAPANLEGTLDPVNPQPSDWGWKTTPGAGTLGFVSFTLPESGSYLVKIILGLLYISGDVGKDTIIFDEYDFTLEKWVTRPGEYVSPTSPENVVSLSNFMTLNSSKFRFRIYQGDKREVKCRIHKVRIFKLR